MRGTTHASPDDIDITGIWGSIRRSLKLLVLASLLTGGLTFAVLSLMAPRFTSEAQLTVAAKSAANPFTDGKDSSRGPDSVNILVDPAAVNTHVRALKSPDLARRVAEELKLGDLVEFNSALGSADKVDALLRALGLSGPRPGESEQDRVLVGFFKGLDVYAAKESRFIGVRFTSSDSELAAEIANRIVNGYRASLAEQTVDEIGEVQKVVEDKIQRLSKEVSEADVAVENFKSEHDLFRGGQSKVALPEQQLGELTAELTRAKAARSEIEARARAARDMMKSGSADALPDAQKSPLIQALVQQRVRLEREISELSATLLPAHPRMRQLGADLDGLKKQLGSEISKLVDSLEREAKVAALREESITRSLDEVKSEESKRSGGRVELRRLEDVAKSKQDELKRALKDLEEAKLKTRTRIVPIEVKILSKAVPSSVPVFPKKGPMAGLVAMATLLFGIAWVVTRSLLSGARAHSGGSHPMRRVDDHSKAAASGGAAAAVGPLSSASVHRQPAIDLSSTAEATEVGAESGGIVEVASIAKLARHVRSRASRTGGFRTLVTSASNTIDPSVEGLALAEALAREGQQTIVIDWSVDEQGFSQRIGLSAVPGFNDLARGEASFEDVIRSLPDGAVHIVPAGVGLGAPVEVALDCEKLNLLLDALDEAYQQIVVVAKPGDARALFEAIQGRFDAGVTVAAAGGGAPTLKDPPGTFLGFEVTEIALVRFTRTGEMQHGQRVVRRGLPAGTEIRI
ncbi:MAG: lipopolysaccharide biosynthesis protein [Hyphomicrobiaceae bacterium]|nr:lipopolysaccharide biosynthesis protein [Hyphomicrobiaceae bacterium]MCC0008593.1 lipopolysaccharide biosynthesis protein [Hyphomicrobiaceae bacterium]